MKFGLSPFGIWRPGFPETACCFDQYDVLYADAKLWLNKGWIDYFSPQLYWPITRPQQSFPILLRWWADENTQGRHLWPGINVGDTSRQSTTEVLNQIMVTRGMVPQSKGVIHWSIGQVVRNQALGRSLLDGPYKRNALVPASPWLDDDAPGSPSATVERLGDSVKVSLLHSSPADVFRSVVYCQYDNGPWNYVVLNRREQTASFPAQVTGAGGKKQTLTNIRVSAVDRTGNESERREVRLPSM